MAMKSRILVIHTIIQPHGGACGVLVWTLQALVRDYDVTLLTWKPFDLPEMNRYFGTSLDTSELQIRHVNSAIRRIFELDPDPGSIQPNCYLMRVCKRIRTDFDLVLTTDNEADLGGQAIQYVHVPQVAHNYPKVLTSLAIPMRQKVKGLWQGKVRPWMLVCDYSFERMRRNRTIVNSDWTGRRFRTAYQAEAVTLYPPAPGEFPDVDWQDREDGFVIIGRLNPDKRPDWCIKVLELVRRSFPALRVHVIGSTSSFWDEAAYYRTLIPLIEANASWVTLHENISRQEMQQLVARQRYGIHAMLDEHFGMAPAEMVLAGCIPFVHNSGGPPEIVGHDARLIYDSAEEAAEKILHVLRNPTEQAEIRGRLAPRKEFFRSSTFMNGILNEVRLALKRSPNEPRRGFLP
jgi:glycosyltransferase involved in cell wall biosynthesis